MGPKSLSGLTYDPKTPLGRLAAEAAARIKLTDQLRSGIGEALGQHIVAANLRDDGTLIVLAAGPAWAARLRYESDKLLALARALKPGTARVRVRVAQGQ